MPEKQCQKSAKTPQMGPKNSDWFNEINVLWKLLVLAPGTGGGAAWPHAGGGDQFMNKATRLTGQMAPAPIAAEKASPVLSPSSNFATSWSRKSRLRGRTEG